MRYQRTAGSGILFFSVWLCAASSFGQASATTDNNIGLGEPLPGIARDSNALAWNFQFNGSFGAASVTDPDTGKTQIYNTIALQPELGFSKFALGLDLYVYFDSNGKARKQDWDKAGDLVTKIWYARWGCKGEPLYARVGGLSGVTLGHGFIMGGYSNRLRYPDVRKVGGVLDFDLGFAGAETMLGDVQRATLLGARVFARPLYGSGMPLFEGLSLGASGVTDRDPDSNKGTRDDQVSVYGLDAELPVFANESFSAKVYADAAMMRLGRRYTDAGSKNNGKGLSAGLGGNLFFLDYKAEMRTVDNNFVPDFFDGYYEVDRSTAGVLKADRIQGGSSPRRTGPLAALYANVLDKIRIGGSYESLNHDPLQIYPHVHGEVRIDPSLLFGRLQLLAQYDRRHARTFKALGQTRNRDSILSTEITYLANANLRLTAVFKQTYDEMGRPVRSTQLRADVHF